MKIGVPKEIKNNEFRVGLTPSSVAELVNFNHHIFIQSNAGLGIGFLDEDYIKAGAVILDSPSKLYSSAELIIKVKEPVPEEFKYLNSTHTSSTKITILMIVFVSLSRTYSKTMTD